MSSELFVTQVSSDQPAILIVGGGAMCGVVAEVAEASGLQTTIVSDDELSLKSALASRTWYKIVVVVPVLVPQQKLETVCSLLHPVAERVVFVALGATSLVARPGEWLFWQQTTVVQTQQLLLLKTALPQAKQILVLDWIAVPEMKKIVAEWVSQASTPTIRFPQLEMSFLDTTTVKVFLKTALIRPASPHKVALKGARINTSHLVKLIQSAYLRMHGQQLQENAVTTQAIELSEDWQIETIKKQSEISGFAKECAASFPSPEKWAESKPVAVLPTPTQNTRSAPKVVAFPFQAPVSQVPVVRKLPIPPTMPTPVLKVAAPTEKAPSRLKSTSGNTLNQINQNQNQKQVASTLVPAEAEIEKTVHDLFADFRVNHKKEQNQHRTLATSKITTKSKRRKKVFLVGVLGSIGLGIGTLSMVLFFLTGFVVEKNLHTFLVTPQSSTLALQVLKPLVKTVASHNQFLQTFLPPSLGQESVLYGTVTHQAWEVLPLTQTWQAKQKQLLSQFFSGGENSTQIEPANTLYEALSQQQGALKEINAQTLSAQNQQALKEYQKWLEQQKQVVSSYQQIQPFLRNWLGYDGKKTYAVLIQNEQELRPTGGFIQAVAIVTVEKGSILNTQVVSSYDLDKKLIGSVTPPPALQQLLGEKNWFLRDANWDPDFPTTAKQVAWFIEKSNGSKVDGVIGMTVSSLQKMIKAIGPVELPDFNETITDRNLAERLEFHSEIQFADTTGQQDYTTRLWSTFWEQLAKSPTDKQWLALATVGSSLTQQEMVVSMIDEAQNQPLLTLGWAGALVNPGCPTLFKSEQCFVDTLAAVETNIGVNKANYYLERSTTHQVTLGKSEVTHVRHTTLKNTAQSNSWPKGSYKVYLRWYVSEGSILDSVLLDGVPLSPTAIATGSEHGQTLWGVVIDVPIQAQSVVTLKYSRPLPYSASFGYAFFNQNQPGSGGSTAQVTLHYDSQLSPQLVAPQATLSPGTIQFSAPTTGHELVGVLFK